MCTLTVTWVCLCTGRKRHHNEGARVSERGKWKSIQEISLNGHWEGEKFHNDASMASPLFSHCNRIIFAQSISGRFEFNCVQLLVKPLFIAILLHIGIAQAHSHVSTAPQLMSSLFPPICDRFFPSIWICAKNYFRSSSLLRNMPLRSLLLFISVLRTFVNGLSSCSSLSWLVRIVVSFFRERKQMRESFR
jgi:hypothetical protein